MSRHTANGVVPSNEADALDQVYRHLGALHATLAEADRVDEGLQRRTLDRLMDVLERIEEVPGLTLAAKPPVSRAGLREHELAVLAVDLPAHGLIAGDVGTVVFIHADGAAYEVEFMTADGETVAVETLRADQVEPVAGARILHVRKHASV